MGHRAWCLGLVALAACLVTAGVAPAQAPDPGGDAGAPIPVPPPGRLFGLNGGGNGLPGHLTASEQADLTAGAGANAIRGALSWQAVEPARDRWSAATWAPFDELYAAARARGLTPILVLGSAPRWARPLLGRLCIGPACSYPPRPAFDGEWAQFAAEAARRYPGAVFEIWNEPNLPSHWQPFPDPERYARLQVVAYDAIKSVNPDAVVTSAGVASIPRTDLVDRLLGRLGMEEFLRRAYNAPSSIKGHMDALAFHIYPGRSGPDYQGEEPNLGPGSGFARGFTEIRAVRDQMEDGELSLLITESGISTMEGVSRAEQASATMRIYRKVLTMDDVAGVVFHRLHAPLELINLWEAGFAWVAEHRLRPFPVYCTFAAAAGREAAGC